MDCPIFPSKNRIFITFENDSQYPSFKPGKYLFSFQYLTRQVGWGISERGKYFTYAAPCSQHFVKDGWPKPIQKEGPLSIPYYTYPTIPWNKVTILFEKPLINKPFVNVGYYMAKDDNDEIGKGQLGSELSLSSGRIGSKWIKIGESNSTENSHTIKLNVCNNNF